MESQWVRHRGFSWIARSGVRQNSRVIELKGKRGIRGSIFLAAGSTLKEVH
jgi:hypothetical protein